MRQYPSETIKSEFNAMDAFDSAYSTGHDCDKDYTFYVWCACRDIVNSMELIDPRKDFKRQLRCQLSHFGCLDSSLE